MSEDKPFRYLDRARSLGESLAEIKVAEPREPDLGVGALDRILQGDTAFGKSASDSPKVNVPVEIKKMELKQKLQTLLTEKQKRELNKQLKVACFVARVKRADPTDPDGASGSPLPGERPDGREEPKKTERRQDGVHQGPAANLIARGLRALRAEEEANKHAARMDKEIAKGNIRLQDVDPAIPAGLNNTAYGRWASRQNALEAAPMTPAQLAYMDRMDRAWKNNQHLLGQRALERQAAGHNYAPSAHPLFGMDPNATYASNALHRQDQLASTVHNRALPGMGAATVANDVYVPDTTARQLRTYAARQPARTLAGTYTPGLADRLYQPAGPGDATTNRAIMAHEFAEREAARNALQPSEQAVARSQAAVAAAMPGQALPVQPGELLNNASHMGIGPHVQERLHARGNPHTNQLLDEVRAIHPDDRLIKNKIRQMGYAANRPMPADSRATRTLEAFVKKNPHLLDKKVQQQALGKQLQMDMHGVPITFANLPQKARNASKALVAQGSEAKKVLKGVRQQGLVGGARTVAQQVGALGSRYRAFVGALK